MATNENLKRLSSAFTVRDIMVTIGDLVCATGESDASSLSKSHPDFNLIPIRNGNGLSAYYSRDSHQLSQIVVPDLIGDGTGILDLVDILESREFVFVLGPKQIDGYIHFSDLNRPLVKFTFYVLLQGVECAALDLVKARLTDDDFLKRDARNASVCTNRAVLQACWRCWAKHHQLFEYRRRSETGSWGRQA